MSSTLASAPTVSRQVAAPEHALTLAAVEALVSGLLSATRTQPWIVVTTGFDAVLPSLDVDLLVADVGDVARIHIVATGELTHHFGALLPDRLGVFGGAGRSYPVGFGPNTPPSESPLRFPQPTSERATARLVTDALNHAHAAGLFTQAPHNARTASGTVQGILADGSRAIVMLADGSMATVWQELSFPPVPLDWILQQGQHITGVLYLETRRLSLEKVTPSAAAVEAALPHRSVTLALVREVHATRAVLALHPDFTLPINRSDVSSNPLDSLTSLLTVGEVVPVRMLHLQGGVLHLFLSDVDDDEPIVAPCELLPGGPPWLVEGRSLRKAAEPDELGTIVTELPVLVGHAEAGAVHEGIPEDSVAITTESVVPTAPSISAPPRPRPGPGLRVVEAPHTPPDTSAATLPSATASAAPLPSATASADVPRNEHRMAAEMISTPAPSAAAPPVSGSRALHDTQLSLATATARIGELERQLREVGSPTGHRSRYESTIMQLNVTRAELGEALRRVRTQDEQLAAQRRELRATRREPPSTLEAETHKPRGRRAFWLRVDEWIRHEIVAAWAHRVDARDKADWPLPDAYEIGTSFAASLEKLDTPQLEKALKCVVDVLIGRASSIPSRELHALRSGQGADDAPRTRHDGAYCMRASVEVRSASARRLHYWVRPDGTIELSRIVIHDDTAP